MGINEEDIPQRLAAGMPKEDPTWGEVSAFLESLDSAYPVESVAALESRHVPALVRESRLIHGEQQRGNRRTMKDLFKFKTHRALIGTVVAALIALTAGVGVASALGVNPLSHLLPVPAVDPTVTLDPTVSPELTPQPTAEPTDDDPVDDEADDDEADDSDDSSLETPKATPTKSHDSDESDDDSEEADDEGDDDSDDSSKAGDDDSDQGEDADEDSENDEADDQSGDTGGDHGDDNGGEDEPGDD